MPDYVLLQQDSDDPTVFHWKAVVAADAGPTEAVNRHTDVESLEGLLTATESGLFLVVSERYANIVTRVIEIAPRVVTNEQDTGQWLDGLLHRASAVGDPHAEHPDVPNDPEPEVIGEPTEAEQLAAAIEETA